MKSDNSWKIKRGNIKYYNATAHSYNCQYQEEQFRKYKIALNSLKMSRNNSILDVGCGTGLLIKEFTETASFVVGIDLSKKMIKIAKEKFREYKNVFLICGDADHLSLREKIIDKVFSFTLLQNMPDIQKTTREILRVAKMNSKIILSVNKKSFTKKEFLKLLREVNITITNFIDDKDLKDYLAIYTKVSRKVSLKGEE